MAVEESNFGHIRLEPEHNEGLKAFVANEGVGSVSSWGNRIIASHLLRERTKVEAGRRKLKLQQTKGRKNHASKTVKRKT